MPGSTIVEWIGESFLVMRSEFAGGQHAHSEMSLVLGHSDPNNAYIALYHDDRGVCREYAMIFDGGHWTMTREDPDMHQRFIADVETDRILGRWEGRPQNWTTTAIWGRRDPGGRVVVSSPLPDRTIVNSSGSGLRSNHSPSGLRVNRLLGLRPAR